jgi:flagellar biosynthesis/type III secretory pathway chaperone
MKRRKNIISSDTDNDDQDDKIKNTFVKMLKRTEQQIIEAENRKKIAVDTYNRDLQQLHKDFERLSNIIKKL